MDGQPLPPTGATQAELDALWDQLLADAERAKLAYMQQRVPKDLQPHLAWYISQTIPVDPPPTQGVVNDGDNVPVWASPSGYVLPGGPARAVVVNGVLTRVDYPMAVTTAMVNSGANVVIHDTTAGATMPGSPGAAQVAAHALTRVNVAVPPPP